MSETENEIAAKLESVSRAAAARLAAARARVEAKLAESGATRTCAGCRGQLGADVELSVRLSAVSDGVDIAWEHCEVCERIAYAARRGVPVDIAPATFAGFAADSQERAAALRSAEAFASGGYRRLPFLVVAGPTTGAGKSYLAAAVAERMRAFRWVTHEGFAFHLRQRYSHSPGALDIERMARFEFLLVLDDYGRGPASADVQRALEDVMFYRLDQRKATVITTNRSPTEFKDSVGPRLQDRMRANLFAWVRIEGPSRRERK